MSGGFEFDSYFKIDPEAHLLGEMEPINHFPGVQMWWRAIDNIRMLLMLGTKPEMFEGMDPKELYKDEDPEALLEYMDKYGVDIARYVEETIDELRIGPLPRELRGEASQRVMETAVDLGYDWQPLMKFMNPARAARFDCGAKCMLGCRCGAKWTANEYMDDAVGAGCELITGARVDRVMIEDGRVMGVVGKLGRKQPFEVRAEVVVLAAGGIGTPLIMQNSGFFDAGNGMAMDVTVMVYGVSKERGNASEPPTTVAHF